MTNSTARSNAGNAAPLRVALIVNSSTPGGAESYLYRLYGGLVKRGLVEVTLIGQLPDWPAELGPVIPAGTAAKLTRREPLLPQLRKSLTNARAVRRVLKEQAFDLVHMQYFREKLVLPGYFTTGLPVLWTEHGPLAPNFPRAGLPFLRMRAGRSTIMAVSEAVRESFAEVNITSEIVWNPLPEASSGRPVRQEGRTSDYVLYAGRVHNSKRLSLLLDAARMAPDVQVKIAGDGPDLAVLRESAPSNVKFLGHLSDLGDLMAGCLAVVSTSGREAREGSPMVVLEARNLGVPVLMAEDCHAAEEARGLGANIYAPAAEALAAEIQALGGTLRTKPLAGDERERRGESRWLADTYGVMERTAQRR